MTKGNKKKGGKVIVGSFKFIAKSGKTDHSTSLSAKIAYRNNYSKKNILGEREVLINNLSDLTFIFIKDIFKKRQWDKLIEWAHALYVEVIMKFYANYKPFNLDDHSITSTIRGQTLELTLLSLESYINYLKSHILTFLIKG